MAASISRTFKHVLNQSTSITTNLINHNHVHFPISSLSTQINHINNPHQYHHHNNQHNPHHQISIQMQINMQLHININNNDMNNNNQSYQHQQQYQSQQQQQPQQPQSQYFQIHTQPKSLPSHSNNEQEEELQYLYEPPLSYPPLLQQTCALIKPETVKLGNHHAIIDRIQEEGFNIIDIQEMHLSESRAKQFYSDHKNKKFFHKLLAYMTSGPIYAINLQKNNGIQEWRTLMGPTDAHIARQTAPNTLRAKYGTSKAMNAVHGSDSKPNANKELSIMFT